MLTLHLLGAASRVLGYWAGATGANETPTARILLFHGTPRSEAASLERQLRWLKRHFQVVPLRSLVSAAAGGNGGVGRKVALTFDDGLRSNVEVAYPLLHRLALPATFFVCPGLIDRGRWLPADEMAWRRLHGATARFMPTPQEREAFDLAGWSDLKRLDPALITIGSHTLTHPVLASITPPEVEREVRDSRRQLEGALQRPVEFFSYPEGWTNGGVEACVRRYYRAAVTGARGWVKRNIDSVRLPRLSAPQGVLRLARKVYP